MINRRDFLSQIAIAFTMAGVVHTIPAQAIEPVDESEFVDEIRLPSQIKGLAMFEDNLIIVTYDGVFLAPLDGVKHARFIDDRLLLKLTPAARETIYILKFGHPPASLEQFPVERWQVWSNPVSGRVFWGTSSQETG